MGGHFAELARLAHTRAMAAFAAALTPMLATPPARMFAATNMLVCVLLLLHFCSELLFPLCSGRSGRLRSCRATGAGHRNGDCGGSLGHLGELWVMVWRPDSHGVGRYSWVKVSHFAVRPPVLIIVCFGYVCRRSLCAAAGDNGIA